MNSKKRLRELAPSLPPEGSVPASHWPIAAWIGLAALAWAVVGNSYGLLLGAVVGVGGYALWRRASPAVTRRDQQRLAAQLPFALDICAACLQSGTPVPQAVGFAGEAVGGQLGERLQRIAKAIVLGTPVSEAFIELDGMAAAPQFRAAIARSERTGATLAAGLTQLGIELREEHQWTAQSGVQRAGVWMVLPLCLCFLPAFVVAGLIPIVVSALTEVLHNF